MRWVLFAALCIWMALTYAASPLTPQFTDDNDARRYEALTKELRCLVCQNQSLYDSHADLAADLRGKVADMIRAHRTDKEIIDYFVARYGEFVDYNPRLGLATISLWAGPVILLVIGFLMLRRYFS